MLFKVALKTKHHEKGGHFYVWSCKDLKKWIMDLIRWTIIIICYLNKTQEQKAFSESLVLEIVFKILAISNYPSIFDKPFVWDTKYISKTHFIAQKNTENSL